MRYLAFALLALLLAAPAAQAEPQTPRGIVMAYECEQIDPRSAGFTCRFEGGSIRIQIHENPDTMSPERRRQTEYEFYRIALRYFELGGTDLRAYADFWPPERFKACTNSPKRPWHAVLCRNITATD